MKTSMKESFSLDVFVRGKMVYSGGGTIKFGFRDEEFLM